MPLLSAGGHVELDGVTAICIRGISRDITRNQQVEQQVKKQRDELAQLSRVAVLGELSGSLAHELSQPLTAILSNAQAAQRFLSKEPADLHDVREILGDIVSDDRRAAEIIHRLRQLFQRGEIQPQMKNNTDRGASFHFVLPLAEPAED